MGQNKVLLIIMDGWGLSPIAEGNATFLAETPTLDRVYANYPKLSLAASGLEVGLNMGEMGNSEVGHLNIGSGRVVWEMLPKIDTSIKTGEFFENKVLRQTADYLRKSGGRLQLVGLCSTGGVHSHINHLFSLIDFAVGENLKSIYLHLFTDGRDTGSKEALNFISKTEVKLRSVKIGKIASLIGRYYAMDRDNNWDRVKRAYDLITTGQGDSYPDATRAVEGNYKKGKGDEYFEPSIIDPNGIVKSGDAVIFFNFREDRSKQLLQACESEVFSGFSRQKIDNLFLASMTKYYDEEKAAVIFQPNNLTNVLADSIESAELRQYHTAETEKYAHVTYFFNGGSHHIHKFEKQIVVPSPKVLTYDLMPEMSASAVADKVVEALNAQYDFTVVNFANGDMVGHTGNLQATVKAVEVVDSSLGKVLEVGSVLGNQVFITADHGNCEMMFDPVSGAPYPEHTTSPVPFCYLNLKDHPYPKTSTEKITKDQLLQYSSQPTQGVLADIAPTVVELLGLEKPAEMSGESLMGSLR